MCRWNAYIGQPLLIGELLFRTERGLIDESLHSRMGAETTNGDGFGVGWYGITDRSVPARYRSVNPAWNDVNLRELADHIESPLFLAHIRAALGLEDEPLAAMERAVGFVEEMARKRGVENPVQMTVGISDGERLWAVRYSSARESRTLFLSEDVDALRRLHPDNVRLQQVAEGDRVIVSEPLGDLTGAWIEVPESTGLVLGDGDYERRPFKPR